MATEKETLQARAEELGLETDGTIPQLREAIAAAELEEGAEPSPEVMAPPAPAPVAPVAPDLPDEPVNPVITRPKPPPAGTQRVYEVHSSFWMRTKNGNRLAQNGGTVKLTDGQARKYLRRGNIKLAD